MTAKRALVDAVNDQLVEKQPVKLLKTKHKPRRYVGARILIALLLGFAGGLTASRWMRII